MTTVYLSTEQCTAVIDAITQFRKDGWHITNVKLDCGVNGTGSSIEFDDDIDPKFIFQLAMKAGYILKTNELL